MITARERTELRSLIRQRFKVLRTDVKARETELLAELHQRINERFADQDHAWAAAYDRIRQAVNDVNRSANDELRALDPERHPAGSEHEYVVIRLFSTRPNEGERHQLFNTGRMRIETQVRKAALELERQEADLLTRLVADGLESDEAKNFLGQIPTVGELVPADRLLALERTLQAPDEQR